MVQKLTPKQERFCVEYLTTGNASAAYRLAYNAENSKPEGIHVNASKLLKNAKVVLRLQELRAPVVAAARYGLQEAMSECSDAIALAKSTENVSAFVSAIALRAKLNGLLVERRETGKPGQFDDLSDAELESERKSREAILKASDAAKAAGKQPVTTK